MPIATVIDAGGVWDSSNMLIASFEQIQYGFGNQMGIIYFPLDPNLKYRFYDSTRRNGEVADPFYFFGWNVDPSTIPAAPVTASTPSLNAPISKILEQPLVPTGDPLVNYYGPTTINRTPIVPVLETTKVQTGTACYMSQN